MNDLAAALVRLAVDVEPAILGLVGVGCYVLAVVAFLAGCLRVVRHADAPARAPSGTGTVLCFVNVAVLVTLPSWLDAAGETLFGAARTAASASLGYGDPRADWTATLAAVFTIVSLIGLFAVVRGLFALRAAADGKASVAAAAMHLLGGALAWHVVPLVAAVQETLGITVLAIT